MESLARMASGRIEKIHDLMRPFSNFKFLAQHELFNDISYSLPRIFCEARRANASTLVVEIIEESEETYDETMALKVNGLIESKLWRLTYWSVKCKNASSFAPSSDSLVGYAIIRADIFQNSMNNSTCIFESVFRKYEHFHNFVPILPEFEVAFDSRKYSLPGVMYCQQNGITKACAQVALRSLIATRFPNKAIKPYEINKAAGTTNPEKGLSTNEIRAVLSHFQINYRDIDYNIASSGQNDTNAASLAAYTNLLYAGIENGGGALLGFNLSGKNEDGSAVNQKHIIPFFGHTFNQDTWAPRSHNAYFHLNEKTRYIPSDEWLSSFIGHDDNFGSNYCIPKGFLKPEQVSYVVALLPDDYKSDPMQIEAIAADQLYSLIGMVPRQYHDSFWFKKLIQYISLQDVVFRTRAISNKEYIKHLGTMKDWEGNGITNQRLLKVLLELIPNRLWMVELSIPEIFSTNYGKLGEILFWGDKSLDIGEDFSDEQLQQIYADKIVLMRLPGVMLVRIKTGEQVSNLVPADSKIIGHVPLFDCPPYGQTDKNIP